VFKDIRELSAYCRFREDLMNHFSTALQEYLRALLSARRARLTSARGRGDMGASAVELAIITAVILGIAVALLAAIKLFVNTETTQIHG